MTCIYSFIINSYFFITKYIKKKPTNYGKLPIMSDT